MGDEGDNEKDMNKSAASSKSSSNTRTEIFKCDLCEIQLSDKQALMKHMFLHKRNLIRFDGEEQQQINSLDISSEFTSNFSSATTGKNDKSSISNQEQLESNISNIDNFEIDSDESTQSSDDVDIKPSKEIVLIPKYTKMRSIEKEIDEKDENDPPLKRRRINRIPKMD